MRHRKLTDREWRSVFLVRCKSRSTGSITDEERALIDRAFKTDPERYSEMNADVFDATVPVGSTARAKR